jgi:hypothetical protein
MLFAIWFYSSQLMLCFKPKIKGIIMRTHYLRMTLSGLLLSAACLVNMANATLIDRGNGLIYDTVQDITWLQDANYAQSSGHDSDGRMSWDDSIAWAAGLSFAGFDDWRLFNADPSCGFTYNCTENELGHLFYNEFGLSQNQSVSSLGGGSNANFNLFANVQASVYWSGTEYAPGNSVAWYFVTASGSQNLNVKNGLIYGWAVRDGDVAAAANVTVPEPATLGIFALGLLGLIVRKRQRS